MEPLESLKSHDINSVVSETLEKSGNFIIVKSQGIIEWSHASETTSNIVCMPCYGEPKRQYKMVPTVFFPIISLLRTLNCLLA